jgi:hypothetical protein
MNMLQARFFDIENVNDNAHPPTQLFEALFKHFLSSVSTET